MFNKIKLYFLDNLIYNFAPLLLKFLNIEFEIKYKTKNFSKFIISNHISEFDVFILYYIFELNNITYRFVGDERLKKLPFVGNWGVEQNAIFISRVKDGCKQLIKKVKPNDNIMIFPEGTLYYKPMIIKSNQICEQNNLDKYENVLCPKINGFNTILDIIKPTELTDITLIYHYKNKKYLSKSNKPLTIVNLMSNPPFKITVIIKNIIVSDISNINKDFVNIIFRKKDKLIKKNLD